MEKFKDYRFNITVAYLRAVEDKQYAYSLEASEELSRNDKMSAQYSEQMWEEFYGELKREWDHNNEASNREHG